MSATGVDITVLAELLGWHDSHCRVISSLCVGSLVVISLESLLPIHFLSFYSYYKTEVCNHSVFLLFLFWPSSFYCAFLDLFDRTSLAQPVMVYMYYVPKNLKDQLDIQVVS